MSSSQEASAEQSSEGEDGPNTQVSDVGAAQVLHAVQDGELCKVLKNVVTG